MKKIHRKRSIHTFQQTKGFTDHLDDKDYAIYTCSVCGITGKRFKRSAFINVSNSYDHMHISHCSNDFNKDDYVGKKIKITNKSDTYLLSSNLTRDSVHTIVKPPIKDINGNCGVWVKGVKKRIKILFNDFNLYEDPHKRTR